MAKTNNIVHQYFRKEHEGMKILVKVNPIHFTGSEITIDGAEINIRDLTFDSEIFADLAEDGFTEVSALEFNLYLSGLAGG